MVPASGRSGRGPAWWRCSFRTQKPDRRRRIRPSAVRPPYAAPEMCAKHAEFVAETVDELGPGWSGPEVARCRAGQLRSCFAHPRIDPGEELGGGGRTARHPRSPGRREHRRRAAYGVPGLGTVPPSSSTRDPSGHTPCGETGLRQPSARMAGEEHPVVLSVDCTDRLHDRAPSAPGSPPRGVGSVVGDRPRVIRLRARLENQA